MERRGPLDSKKDYLSTRCLGIAHYNLPSEAASHKDLADARDALGCPVVQKKKIAHRVKAVRPSSVSVAEEVTLLLCFSFWSGDCAHGEPEGRVHGSKFLTK